MYEGCSRRGIRYRAPTTADDAVVPTRCGPRSNIAPARPSLSTTPVSFPHPAVRPVSRIQSPTPTLVRATFGGADAPFLSGPAVAQILDRLGYQFPINSSC